MEAPSSYALRLERRIAAPPAVVFRAWTQAATLVKWFAPSDDMQCHVHEVDVRPGGRLSLDMIAPDGQRHELRCRYEEVREPERLALRWTWASNPAAGESRVTVSLTPDGEGTLLVLVHEGLPDTNARDSHERGWTGCLSRLPSQCPR